MTTIAHLGLAARKTYRVVVTREDTDWIAEAPEVPGAQTWARNLVVLQRGIREAIAAVLDIPESEVDSIDVRLEFDPDSELMRRATVVRALREQVAQLESAVAEQSGPLAAELASEGYSVRDVSVLLGISPGRVSQLATEPARAADDHHEGRYLIFLDSGVSLFVPQPASLDDDVAEKLRGWGQELEECRTFDPTTFVEHIDPGSIIVHGDIRGGNIVHTRGSSVTVQSRYGGSAVTHRDGGPSTPIKRA